MRNYIISICILITLAALSSSIGLADPTMSSNNSVNNQIATASGATQLVFIQMSDVHLSDKKFKDSYFGNETNIDPIAFMNMAVQEIRALKPAFVVVTGDLVAVSDVQDTNTASKVFSTFNDTIQPLILAGIPVHEVVGNHDVVGVNNKTVRTNETGHGKALLLKTFSLSSTYYSFDQGGYHFVILDANNIDNKWNITGKGLDYAINDTQLSWLAQDLSKTSSPVIVFIHEAVQNLKNPENLSRVLKGKDTEIIFSGHWHMNELLNASGVPEQNSGALSAAWWQGPHTDGSQEGYRVVVLNGSRIDSFYRAAGVQKQINIVEPSEAIVTGEVNLKAQIWSNNSTIRNASYSIDNGNDMPMAVSREGIWYASSAKFNASQLSQGYHIINVKATDGNNASFSNNISLKVSDNKTLAIGDLLAHYKTYMGKHVTLKGVVTALFQSGSLVVLQDATGGVHIYTGDCYQPPKFAQGELWTVTSKVGEYSGMSELKLIKSSDANKSTVSIKMPIPAVKKASEIGNSIVGLLVQIKNASVSSIDKDMSGFTIWDDTGKAYVYGKEAKYNTSSIKKGDIVDVTGIGQQYKRTYEVTLRNSSDVAVHEK